MRSKKTKSKPKSRTPKTRKRPRIGVPWRTTAEERNGKRGAYEHYLKAVSVAGGEPVEISLSLSAAELSRAAKSLDGFVLPGSPADVEPRRYGAENHPLTVAPDKKREHADDLLLDHALATGKPVLAICYGVQLLNVHLHGTLVQDISSKVGAAIDHERDGGGPEARHAIRIEGGHLAALADHTTARVNSSHHQSLLEPGRGLRVTARAMDDVVEAVEWRGGPGWIVGVQWHPERMPGDPLSGALFRRLVTEAQWAAKAR
jgi:putative glutamine amidotransferase